MVFARRVLVAVGFSNLKIEKNSIKEMDFDEKNHEKKQKMMKFERKNRKIAFFEKLIFAIFWASRKWKKIESSKMWKNDWTTIPDSYQNFAFSHAPAGKISHKSNITIPFLDLDDWEMGLRLLRSSGFSASQLSLGSLEFFLTFPNMICCNFLFVESLVFSLSILSFSALGCTIGWEIARSWKITKRLK